MMSYAKDSIAILCDLGSIIMILVSVSQQARLRLILRVMSILLYSSYFSIIFGAMD
jgi:hypothetical protein